MKTLKTLKITSILNGIFCFFCVAFVICLFINQHDSNNIVKIIGGISGIGWLINPTPLISFILCVGAFSDEHHCPDMRQIIGKKYLWIYIWPVITTLCYFATLGFLIELTGI